MKYVVLTLFKEMIEQCMHTSIMGRALDSGAISLDTIDIRDYSENKHNRVDDYPYGGGAGMVMAAGPVYRACEAAKEHLQNKNARVVYLTPQGRVFNQEIARELANEEELIFLCGHYEGIDERALEMEVTDYISIGDYVLTGGELPAVIVMDAVSRLIPGVLNNSDSAEFESLTDNLLEYPQYTRPEEFMGRKVPDVLLSGHHANIERWRRDQSLVRTYNNRPDLFAQVELDKKDRRSLNEQRIPFNGNPSKEKKKEEDITE